MADVRRPFRRPNGWYFLVPVLAVFVTSIAVVTCLFSPKEVIRNLMLFLHRMLNRKPGSD
jgi:hypothetical protein